MSKTTKGIVILYMVPASLIGAYLCLTDNKEYGLMISTMSIASLLVVGVKLILEGFSETIEKQK